MITEAVILAGGFGTRLAHLLGDVPKPMAPVYGKPFLTYVLDKLQAAGIGRVVLATGYKHRVIYDYFGSQYKDIDLVYSEETEPLLTGGAILQATKHIQSDDFFVLNGDTLFDIDFLSFSQSHYSKRSVLSIALRRVDNTDRYGAVEINSDGQITLFKEKAASCGCGLINGGIYAINKDWLLSLKMPKKFSFEQELLQPLTNTDNRSVAIYGQAFDNYFIDIGIPEDYHKAQGEFPQLFPQDQYLFLDRDGVINRKIDNGYVTQWKDFIWLPNTIISLQKISIRYKKVFIATNQQGVGKGVFTQERLDEIHRKMCEEISKNGGRIDRVYVCTALEKENNPNRKPGIGMALQAQQDFPEIDFTRSVMVGDALTDMQFGYKAGMRCVYITNGLPVAEQIKDYTDICLNDLAQFSKYFSF